MLKKIKEFLVQLLPKVKKLIRIPHFLEEESAFKFIMLKLKESALTDIVFLLSALFLFGASISLLLFFISFWFIF